MRATPPLSANLRRYAFQRHYCRCPRLFSYDRLLGCGDVHNDATLKHFSQPGFPAQSVVGTGFVSICARHNASWCLRTPAKRSCVASLFYVFLDVLGEHLQGIDGDKQGPSARQDLMLLVADFCDVDVFPAANALLVTFNQQRLFQRHRLNVFHFHVLGEGNHRTQLVYLAHGLIQDGGDNAAVRMAGRTLVSFGEPKPAICPAVGLIEAKPQAHTLFVVLATGEAAINGYGQILDLMPTDAWFLCHKRNGVILTFVSFHSHPQYE